MIKLSDLKDDVKIIDENYNVYTVEDVKNDLSYFKRKKIYTTIEYQASIDALDMIKSAIESEYDNMYEGWNENILNDIEEEDILKMQAIFNDILNRNKDQNVCYDQGKKIEINI